MNHQSETQEPLLKINALAVSYSLPSQRLFGLARKLNAVDGVSLSIKRGDSFGLVGETGCGKSSLSRAICGLAPLSRGTIQFKGMDLASTDAAELRPVRKDIQMIFQDPGGSLNPRMRAGELVAEPLEIHGVGDRTSRRQRVINMLQSVGLAEDDADRYPHEFSGGQRQRIAIARAVVIEPALILADEPVSSLDVSLQAQILNLIADLRSKLGLTLLFVSHDLNVVRYLCGRVAVMYLGQIVEQGPTRTVFGSPRHPYTKELVASSPVPDPGRPIRLVAAVGEPPNPATPPNGCRSHPRCSFATGICGADSPEIRKIDGSRYVACHHAEQIANLEEDSV